MNSVFVLICLDILVDVNNPKVQYIHGMTLHDRVT